MPAKAPSRRPTARAETAALPQRRRREAPAAGGTGALVRKLAPSRRSLAIGLGILSVALGGYAIARETSIFALDRIDVRGGSSVVDAQVQRALASLEGTSLVGLSGAQVLQRVDALPTVVSATYDRAFPHTLRVTVVPEQPVAVLRAGSSAWLVSERGRVVSPLAARADAALPHIWLGGSASVHVGELLPSATAGIFRALGQTGAFGRRVATASLAGGVLIFHLRSGIELVLGAPAGIPLKVAVATQALQALPAGSVFLDVSVPGRPVSGTRMPPAHPQQTSTRG
ncbi:MAG TPA: FtsQ-type POTRA domain-containing protein [Gaiellaceae bacterium]|nr:FtsQ-type POTRA domain-containing protein [Gaiellaceae bacterium]